MMYRHITLSLAVKGEAGVGVVPKQQEYLLNAEQCCEIAALGGNDKHCHALLAMARTWRELAAEEERISDLVRVVDELYPPKVNRPNPEELQTPKSLIRQLEKSLLGRTLLRKFGNGNSRPRAQFRSTDTEAINYPRWISKRIFTMPEVRE